MDTLCIIGNGFDLHHGIASSYEDFRQYVWKKCGLDGYWIGQLEACYPTKNKDGKLELWCDLEYALGNIDFQNAFDESTEDVELEEDHEMRYQAQMEEHSLSDIDFGYFMEIAKNVASNTQWLFSVYYNNSQERNREVNRVKDFINTLGLTCSNCQTFCM